MTKAFGQVPIPSYDVILNQRDSGLQDISQGVITVTAPPVKTSILPEDSNVETIASLDYSQYSEIGALTAPSSLNAGGSAVDEEMQRSIWSIMAVQDNDYLLYNTAKTQGESEKNDSPTYFPLVNPLAPYASLANGNVASAETQTLQGNVFPATSRQSNGFSGSYIYLGQSPNGYVYTDNPCLFRCFSQPIYQ